MTLERKKVNILFLDSRHVENGPILGRPEKIRINVAIEAQYCPQIKRNVF